jgi:hypothetical protein
MSKMKTLRINAVVRREAAPLPARGAPLFLHTRPMPGQLHGAAERAGGWLLCTFNETYRGHANVLLWSVTLAVDGAPFGGGLPSFFFVVQPSAVPTPLFKEVGATTTTQRRYYTVPEGIGATGLALAINNGIDLIDRYWTRNQAADALLALERDFTVVDERR